MRSVFKFLSLPKSSFSATSIGVAVGFELPGVVTIAGVGGKLVVGFEDTGAGAGVVVELGLSTAG